MPVAPDVQSLTTAAEQSASGGDFASAAHYLKLAADLQEAGAGSMPSELANTLNNLGVVYERLDRPDDAERCYRRSYAVARSVFPADHPSVVLSEKNLRDFCEGRGISFEQVPDAGLKPRPTTDRAEDRPRSMLVLGAIAAMALVALAFIAVRSIGRNDAPSTPAPASPVATPAAPPTAAATPSVPPPAAPEPEPRAPAPEPAPVSAAPAPVRPEPPPPVARAAVVPTVVSASVCGSLRTSGEWQCGPLTGGPGTFFFVTRLAAPAATTVEHRWYRDGRLHQSVTLRVSANPQHGYRTYSRVTIGAERAGEWRTELRSSAGTVLHEERFTVVP